MSNTRIGQTLQMYAQAWNQAWDSRVALAIISGEKKP